MGTNNDNEGQKGFEKFSETYFKKLLDAKGRIPIESVYSLCKQILEIWNKRKQLFIFGNGGSAGNAIHLANDFLYGVSRKEAPRIKIHALPANSSVITCLANDEGYESIFSEQLKTLAEKGDLVLALSGSGNSPNIIKALTWCKKNDIKTAAILGYDGGKAKLMVDVSIHIPVEDMQVSEDLQLIIGHLIMQYLCK